MKTTKRTDYVEKRTTEWEGNNVVEDFDHFNDIAIEKGDIAFASGVEAVKNVVEAVVGTIRGEMPMDRRAGIPYFENALGVVGEDVAEWAGMMQNAIEGTNGVTGMTAFEYSVASDGRNRRVLSYTATVETKYGKATVTNVKN